MSKTYIIGHQKPDTDSVVAAMAAAFFYQQISNSPYQTVEAAIIDELNPETTFLFEKFGVDAPKKITAADLSPDDQVILVDHNEQSQRLENLPEDQIVEIIDHHKANINFNTPVTLTFKPWGSTCGLLYHLMKIDAVKPDKQLAALMLASVLSDTVGFKSSTTTPVDEQLGKELAALAEIDDIDAFALEIFKAKSDVSSLTPQQIVTNDFKVFDFGGKKVFIDQLETVEQDAVIANRKDELLAAMKEVKTAENVDLLFVIVTDILKVNSKLLLLGEEEIQVAEAAFDGKSSDNVLDIGPKLSRKKDVAPAIEKELLK